MTRVPVLAGLACRPGCVLRVWTSIGQERVRFGLLSFASYRAELLRPGIVLVPVSSIWAAGWKKLSRPHGSGNYLIGQFATSGC